MVYFVGAGSGAVDLITVRGMKLLEQADVVIYAGSLVNPELLSYAKETCQIYNSAEMTLEEVRDVMIEADKARQKLVRLHTGDPCLYGAIREQMDQLEPYGIAYEVCPGVSSFCGAASALNLEYTLPEVSQSVVITRISGRTPVPERETIASFAAHQTTMVIFLSMGMLKEVTAELLLGGYQEDTPAAIVYKATWPDEKKVVCTVATLVQRASEEAITKTALIIVGDVISQNGYRRSCLYDPKFATEFRAASKRTEEM
ncbi:MAG: precorrin-4 C(11)-methyltransferase [Hungatella sp.]